jgi:hypothetical protein
MIYGGTVSTLESGTGTPALDDQLKRAFFGATYRPATRNGQAVPGQLRQPVIFE